VLPNFVLLYEFSKKENKIESLRRLRRLCHSPADSDDDATAAA
jgi:hypothetical protein